MLSRIEWDPSKAESNLKKHGISFEEAATVLVDPLAITYSDNTTRNEQRDITVGTSALGKLLLVVYVEKHGNVIRIVSA